MIQLSADAVVLGGALPDGGIGGLGKGGGGGGALQLSSALAIQISAPINAGGGGGISGHTADAGGGGGAGGEILIEAPLIRMTDDGALAANGGGGGAGRIAVSYPFTNGADGLPTPTAAPGGTNGSSLQAGGAGAAGLGSTFTTAMPGNVLAGGGGGGAGRIFVRYYDNAPPTLLLDHISPPPTLDPTLPQLSPMAP